MKINKKYNAILEWILAIILIVVCFKYSILSYGSFSPIKAHQQSERTYHYGPSKIIKTIDLKGGKIYLCKYKDWFSANTVKKGLIKWYPSGQLGGKPIDYLKQVSYSWSNSHIKGNVSIMKIYGYVNNSDITTILAEEDNETNSLRYDLDESRMFIFYWNENEVKYRIKYLIGLNKEGKVIYEKKFF